MRATSGAYFSRLDHLRLFASALVFSWHSLHALNVPVSYVPSFPALSLLEEGHTGVALFLTLSGYLFTMLCRDRDIDARAFYKNRILRILPLYVFWVMFYVHTIPTLDSVKIAINSLFLINKDIPGVGWTIIVEAQFYLLFPFLLRFYHQRGARYLAQVLALSIVFKLVFWAQGGATQDLAYWTLFGRIDQFLCGMLAAAWGEGIVKETRFRIWTCAILSLVALIAVYHGFNLNGGFYDTPARLAGGIWCFLPAVEGVLYAMLIVGYLHLPIRIPRLLDVSLAKLGEVSYSIYWSHYYIVGVVGAILHTNGVVVSSFGAALMVTAFISFPVCAALSFATYHLIEKPFLGLRTVYVRNQTGDARLA